MEVSCSSRIHRSIMEERTSPVPLLRCLTTTFPSIVPRGSRALCCSFQLLLNSAELGEVLKLILEWENVPFVTGSFLTPAPAPSHLRM